ncbi:MAG: flagellar FliJ family protein [Clostridia bacterium]|nr:flagellar FliJ family protein [Clostridia bacterium]
MKKFKFTYQVLLENAEELEQACAVKLKEIRDILSEAEKRKETLSQQKNVLINKLQNKNGSQLNIHEFKESKIFIEELSQSISIQEQEIQKLSIIEEERLTSLKEAKKQLNIYEKLKANQYKAYIDKIKKDEEKELEERIMYKYSNNSEVEKVE